MIMEHFNLNQSAASRQLSRIILPEMMKDGMTFAGEDAVANDEELPKLPMIDLDPQQHEQEDHDVQGGVMTQQPQQQPR